MTVQRDEILPRILAVSLDDMNSEFYWGGQVYDLPDFEVQGLDPDDWLPTSQKNKILKELILRFPPKDEEWREEAEKGKDGRPLYFSDIGMTPANIQLFSQSPSNFLGSYLVSEGEDIEQFEDLISVLWGHNFLYGYTRRYMRPTDGLFTTAYVSF